MAEPLSLTPSPNAPQRGSGPFEANAEVLVNARYLLLSRLGQGGGGEVWRARHVGTQAECAIKLLDPALLSKPAQVQRFLREARLLAQVRHPGIVRVFDVDRVEGRPFLAMDLLEGETLSALIRQGPAPIPLVIRLAQDLVEALAAAHAEGVIHRDLKPANLFLARDKDGTVLKILDFGLARNLTDAEATELTCSDQILGTPRYMAPEQQVDPARVDERADIFAVGAILYQLLTSHPHLEGKSLPEVWFRLRQSQYDRHPLERRGDVPPALDELVARCLAPDPDDRYGYTQHLLDTIKELGVVPPLRELYPSGSGIQGTEQTVDVRESSPLLLELSRERLQGGIRISSPSLVNDVPPVQREWTSQTGPTQNIPGRRALPATTQGVPERVIPLPTTTTAAPGGGVVQLTHTRGGYLRMVGGLIAVILVVGMVWMVTGTREFRSKGRSETVMPAARSTTIQKRTEEAPPVALPKGTFRQGFSESEVLSLWQECSRWSNSCSRSLFQRATPLREVDIDAFRIDVMEMSRGRAARILSTMEGLHLRDEGWLYRGTDVLALLPSSPLELRLEGSHIVVEEGGKTLPLVRVTWAGARMICQAAGGDLPTEAQWEYAARGVTNRLYPWGNRSLSCEEGAFGRGPGGPCEVMGGGPDGGGLAPGDVTPEGIHDLGGNVLEWTLDPFTESYAACAGARCEPPAVTASTHRVIRGAGWLDPHPVMAAAVRSRQGGEEVSASVGFRCVYNSSSQP